MIVQALVFYMFAAVAVAGAAMVVASRNPVHSVLFLVLTFFNAAGLFVLQGAEFLAMVLIIVYVGAVAVLFLFVVMMLDVDLAQLRQGFVRFLPVGATVGLILMAELVVVVGGWAFAPALGAPAAPAPSLISNTHALGAVLYTQYLYLFQVAGVVLLIGMVGAIVLTHRRRDVKRQNIGEQVRRDPADEIELRKVATGKGI